MTETLKPPHSSAPRRRGQRKPLVSRNHAVRSLAKDLAAAGETHYCDFVGHRCLALPSDNTRNGVRVDCDVSGGDKSSIRPRLEYYLNRSEGFHNQHFDVAKIDYALPKSLHGHVGKRTWTPKEVEEGRDIARSDIGLPSDGHRDRLTLSREDAFCDYGTCKNKVRIAKQMPLSEDAQVAQLYQDGYLYDDNKTGAADALTLNSIRHDGFLYQIRGPKKGRQNKNKKRNFQQLSLDLSSSGFGNDNSIRHLMEGEFSFEDIQHAHMASLYSAESSPRLRVVYEAPDSPVFDVDASQPPDLDSDFDCISDQELTDAPSSQEVHDDDSGPWIVVGDGL